VDHTVLLVMRKWQTLVGKAEGMRSLRRRNVNRKVILRWMFKR